MWGTIMRKLLHTTAAIAVVLALSTATNAADVGVRPPVYQAPPAYVRPPFSWTGFYIVGNNSFTITNVTTGASIPTSNNNTNSGWLVGAGIEWAFAPNWSAKIEYDYLGLDSRTFTVPAGVFLAGDTFTTTNPNVQMVKVGINYRFNYGVGRY